MTSLTIREKETLQLAADGLGTMEAAVKLGISTGTVKMYRSVIIEKLGARNMVHAVALAFRHGILQ